MKADEGSCHADQRAGDHAGHGAGDLTLEPIGPREAIEDQSGEDADGENNQKGGDRAQAHVRSPDYLSSACPGSICRALGLRKRSDARIPLKARLCKLGARANAAAVIVSRRSPATGRHVIGDWHFAAYRLSSILKRGDRLMALGTVKWFNSQKGYGFIQPQAGGQDVFVHISAVERAGLSSLNEGQQVEYEIITDRGKQSAGNLKVK
jgi:CspA family cold shock protein